MHQTQKVKETNGKKQCLYNQSFYFHSYLFQAWLSCDNEPILPLVCRCLVQGGGAGPSALYDQAMAESGEEEGDQQEQGGHSIIYKETSSLK
jgi:hypothetical protein